MTIVVRGEVGMEVGESTGDVAGFGRGVLGGGGASVGFVAFGWGIGGGMDITESIVLIGVGGGTDITESIVLIGKTSVSGGAAHGAFRWTLSELEGASSTLSPAQGTGICSGGKSVSRLRTVG